MGVIAPDRERAPAPGHPPRAPEPAPPGGGRRRIPWGPIALLAVVLALVAVGRDFVGGLLPSFPNPFAAETVDRTGPAVLHAIRDLREFRAATGSYEVIVDLERDTRFPAAILGERILFVASGTVDATVDFSALGEDAVDVSADRTAATITLPAPVLSEPRLDLGGSYVYDRQRGILDALGGPSDLERDAYLAAETKLEEAARETSELPRRAEESARVTLTALLRALGFERVTVRFE